MPGAPVVISEKYGIPVRPVDRNAPVLTVSESGLGAPIVITENGAPFIVEGLIPPWVDPNALLAMQFGADRYWLGGAGLLPATSVLATTRASGINLPDAAGVYQSIGVNELPRTDRGLYANGQFTNLMLHSNEFDDEWYSTENLTVGEQTGDFTLLTAEDGTGVAPQLERSSGTITGTGRRLNQIVVRPVNWTRFSLSFTATLGSTSNQSAKAIFELSGAGSVIGQIAGSGTAAGVRRLNDTDYLIWITTDQTATSVQLQRFQFAMVKAGATNPSGDEDLVWNPTGDEQVLVRDAQAFDGIAFPVEAVIRTADATATLLASDIRAVQGIRPDTNPEPFPGWQAAGLDDAFGGKTIVTIDRLNAAAARFITGAGVDANNLTKLIFDTDNRFKLVVRKSGVDEVALQTGAVASTGDKTIEWQAKPGDYSIDATGVAGDTGSDAETLPAGSTTLRVGSDFGVLNPFNGWIKELQILKVAA